MDVLAVGPLPAASLLWRLGTGPWTVTIVCKATFELRPGQAVLAPYQAPIYETDQHTGDDGSRSVLCPADVVPSKGQCDVIVVGRAFAPQGKPVERLDVRLIVGELDKSLHVLPPTQEGGGQGQPFTTAPLSWEYAAGGPGTDNPVGIPAGIRQPSLRAPSGGDAPAGFGPLGATWPSRLRHTGGVPPAELNRDGEQLLPDDFDFRYFNAAPADQRLDTLTLPLDLCLENLHARHAVLQTRIPDAAPKVVLRRGTGPSEDVPLQPDTLWIDTSRALATVTWRAAITLQARDEKGQIRITPPENLKALSSGAEVADRPEMTSPIAVQRWRATGARSTAERRADLPFAGSSAPPPLATSAGVAASVAVSSVVSSAGAQRGAAFSSSALGEARRPTHGGVPVVPPLPEAAAPLPPEPVPHGLAGPLPPIVVPMAAAPLRSASGEMSTVEAAARLAPAAWSRPDALGAPPAPAPALAPLPTPAAPSPAPAPPPRPSVVVQLLWFDEACPPRVRARWRKLSGEIEVRPAGGVAPDHQLLFGILTEAEATPESALDRIMRETVSDTGRFTPPLVMLEGYLRLPFDEVKTLEATAEWARPIAAADKKVKDALANVDQLLESAVLCSSPEVVGSVTRELTKTYRSSRVKGKLDLDEQALDRVLLEQRAYQSRTLLGDAYLRALLGESEGNGAALVAYLPAALKSELPLMTKFKARLVAEVHTRQDQYEASAVALRVVALGRVLQLDS